ncbi:hypothetical protein [Gimesia panareensis]|uniref:hypothetical protein n=1 Tax=Gimesia panareensis TaxID=2527978 RepID=UPI00118AD81D|nr:hypothetical protein [Gimesia panareensis]QDU50975.1 hypothetical protein Pan110_33360 [Gimesia panareensis]
MNAIIDKRLNDIAEALKAKFSETALRGSGSARFVYVQANGRAAEASIDNDAVWIEFWDAGVDDDPIPSVREKTVNTANEAQTEIAYWLMSAGAGGDE